MKTILTILAIALLCALVPTAAPAWNINNIGVYTTPTPSQAWSYGLDQERILWANSFGLYDVYLVCFNPYDLAADAPIELLGGFELGVVLPRSWILHDAILPAGIIDVDITPDGFMCGGVFPAGEGPVLLATLVLLTFAPETGGVFLSPHPFMPSLAGHMAIANAERDGALSPAFPTSGNFDIPVMGINPYYLPNENVTWGDVKALYRP